MMNTGSVQWGGVLISTVPYHVSYFSVSDVLCRWLDGAIF